jgi:hypothetical protein
MGVWRSDDGGDTWDRVFYDGNYGATHTNTLSVHPVDSDVVLVGDLHGRISRTSDAGVTWTSVFENETPLFALGFAPSAPDTAYAGDADGNVLKSTDGGVRWTHLARIAAEGIGSLAVSPVDADVVFAGTRRGVFTSTDGGRDWRQVGPEPGQAFEVVQVTVAPSRPDLVLAATPEGVFHSRDGGTSWTRSLDRHTHSVGVAAEPQRLWAGTDQGVYRSDDGGDTWAEFSSGISYLDIGPLTVHPEDPDVVLLGSNIWQWTFHYHEFPGSTSGEGIYKTVDGGASWSGSGRSFVDVDVISVAVDPNDPDLVYIGMECSRGIFRSSDGGESWQFILGGPETGSWDVGHYTMRLEVDADSRVFLTGRFGVTRSVDEGRSWIPTLVRRHFHGVGVSPHDPQLAFVGTSPKQDPTEADDFPGTRILRTTDGGITWRESGSGFPSGTGTSIHAFAFDATDADVVYVATSSLEFGLPQVSTSVGIYKSTDRGQTWEAVNRGLTRMMNMVMLDVNALATSPTKSEVVYAGTERGVFRSVDGGGSWIPTRLTAPVRSAVVDPVNTDTVYAGTIEGLFWSDDGGSTWRRIESVPPKSVTDLAIDPEGRVLYAAVNDVGVFKGAR